MDEGFVPGLRLAGEFYAAVVRTLLGRAAVVTARLARDLMGLWLLMNRRYPPYSKWLGSPRYPRAVIAAG